MDSPTRKQAQPIGRKGKKKQVKDEFDRIKQAEKKKRRLEKALAASAAIISELEKKKQKKKEEQRLDEEGAAIAEAVALHVLLGEEANDSSKIMPNEDKGFKSWDDAVNTNMYMHGSREYLPLQGCANSAIQGFGFASNAFGYAESWNGPGKYGWSGIQYQHLGMGMHDQCIEPGLWDNAGVSAGLIAARAVSSLQISEDAEMDGILVNGTFRG